MKTIKRFFQSLAKTLFGLDRRDIENINKLYAKIAAVSFLLAAIAWLLTMLTTSVFGMSGTAGALIAAAVAITVFLGTAMQGLQAIVNECRRLDAETGGVSGYDDEDPLEEGDD